MTPTAMSSDAFPPTTTWSARLVYLPEPASWPS
jgi:hypothetical protein